MRYLSSRWRAFVLGLLIALAGLLGGQRAWAQTTTVVTANVKDVSGNIVPTGQVTFDLEPGIDTTISGNARFTPQTTVCTINQAQNGGTGAITSLARASNVVTATFSAQTTFIVGDVLSLGGWSDATFDGTSAFTVTAVSAVSPWTVTWNQTAANSSATGGVISALRASPGPGSCTLTENTALTPAGTYYKVTIWPNYAPTAAFNFYALTATQDLSSVVPTPATVPAFSFVDLFSNQTISGAKTFSGAVSFSAPVTMVASGLTIGGVAPALLPISLTAGVSGVLPPGNGGTGDSTGNAPTASALATTPSTCGAGVAATGINAAGNPVGCFTPANGGLFTEGTDVTANTVANSATATTLMSINIPAGDMNAAGRMFQFVLTGIGGDTASPTLTITADIDGAAIGTLSWGTLTAASNQPITIEGTFTVLTAGTSGTVTYSTVRAKSFIGGGIYQTTQTANTFTVDTIVAHTFSIVVTWSAANTLNTITAQAMQLRRIE